MTKKRNQKNYKNQKNQKRKRKTKRFLIFELILILILVPTAFFLYQFGRMQKPETNLNLTYNDIKNSNLKGYRNIAIFGVDSRSNDLKKNTRSDSIIIASIHKKTKDVKLLSIYRDTYVMVPGHGYTKINHAYSYGGPELALNTINQNFDLNITDFVTVNFSSVANMVDLVGGITLDITSKEELKYVNAYTRDVARINGTKLEYLKSTGKQTVNGTQATGYSRVRFTAGGDFKRSERQRIVVNEVVKKAKKSSIPTLVHIVTTMMPQIYTSLSEADILILGKDIFSYNIVDSVGFPYDLANKKISGVFYVQPTTLSSNVIKMHKELFGVNDYIPSDTVQTYSNDIASR